MLSDEEKQAIEELKNKKADYFMISNLTGKTLVNLIEKQQKEIEELRNEVMEKELMIDGMKEDRRIAVEEIQEQYYVSKDKIKAKIEEVHYKMIGHQDLREAVKQALQSLLEKE